MKVTDVRIRKIYEEGKMKAIVSVTFDEEFVVHDIKIIDGENGLFIAMPSRKIGEGEFRDIAHPINSLTREKIQEAVFEEYERELEELKEKFEETELEEDSGEVTIGDAVGDIEEAEEVEELEEVEEVEEVED